MKKKFFIFSTFFYGFTIILIPIFGLFPSSQQIHFDFFIKKIFEPLIFSSYTTTLFLAFIAALINTFFGFLIAWVLNKYNFHGKILMEILIDLPFSLPTSVAGLTLITVYSDEGWIGFFLKNFHIEIIFTKLGILFAMIFVSFPFVIRTLQPVLQELEIEIEEVAWSLGASPFITFLKLIFPTLMPSLFTGFTLAFSRSIGEYGSIIILASNFPFKDLLASTLIFQFLEQYDFLNATILGTLMLGTSLFFSLGIFFIQKITKN